MDLIAIKLVYLAIYLLKTYHRAKPSLPYNSVEIVQPLWDTLVTTYSSLGPSLILNISNVNCVRCVHVLVLTHYYFFVKGVMSLLRPLLLDIVPTIQQTAALALGRLANYNDDLAEAVVKGDILPQLVYSLAEQNVSLLIYIQPKLISFCVQIVQIKTSFYL